MKFEKFVKSLGLNGVIHERGNGERWITGNTVTMKIPEAVKGVMAKSIAVMPATFEEYVNYEYTGIPSNLSRAIMPTGDAAIKDCIRVFTSENGMYECGINNNDFALIEKSDVVEMYISTNKKTYDYEPKGLLIKKYVSNEKDPELVGFILKHIETEEEILY